MGLESHHGTRILFVYGSVRNDRTNWTRRPGRGGPGRGHPTAHGRRQHPHSGSRPPKLPAWVVPLPIGTSRPRTSWSAPLIRRWMPRACSGLTRPSTPRPASTSSSRSSCGSSGNGSRSCGRRCGCRSIPALSRSPLRGGRAVGWFVDALAPLAATHPGLDLRGLRSTCAPRLASSPMSGSPTSPGSAPDDAIEVMRTNATDSLVRAARAPEAITKRPRARFFFIESAV